MIGNFTPRPMTYYGSKQGKGKSNWIAGLLPWRQNTLYLEPYCGMAAVLCTRRPVDKEMLNDINDRLVNWWRAVRDYPDEFGHMVECTPHSRTEYNWAVENLDNAELSVAKRALALHIVLWLNVTHGDGNLTSGAGMRYAPTGGSNRGRWRSERVAQLAERLFNVQLECRDALDVLDRVKDESNSVVYVDPPYPTSNVTPYRFRDVDMEKLKEVLENQKGSVAISGYGEEWDRLGWQRHEMNTVVNHVGRNAWRNADQRTEVLWTNYDAYRHGSMSNLRLF